MGKGWFVENNCCEEEIVVFTVIAPSDVDVNMDSLTDKPYIIEKITLF